MSSSSSILQYLSSNSNSQNVSQTNNNIKRNAYDNGMLEHSSDRTDDSHDDNERIVTLNRQVIIFDDNWKKTQPKNESKVIQSASQGEAILLEAKQDETQFLNSNQHQVLSSDKTKPLKTVRDIMDTISPDELDENTEQTRSHAKTDKKISSPKIRTQTNMMQSPMKTSTPPTKKITNGENRKSTSKVSHTSKSLSQSRLRSPNRTTNKRQVPSMSSTGAFHFVTPCEHQEEKRSKKVPKSNSHSSPIKDDRKRITSSDDEESETDHLNPNVLKLKLKEEKRIGKKTGELLNQLHENYEELLEKYAQAENTIDQLRFQPKPFSDTTPRSTTSEHHVHIIQQPIVNMTNLRASGVYHSINDSPFSTIRPLASSTTTPVKKSISPAYSEEVITPETYTVNLLVQTRTLGNKMKSFLTLMTTDQLSLAEQKQVYENIKQDYEKLVRTLDKQKYGNNYRNIGLDGDINTELDSMKHLLKEIVERITNNLLGKSGENSPTEQRTRLTLDGSNSSPLSARSSLCNHNDLMDQYRKLLNAVNTESTDRIDQRTVRTNELENDPKQMKANISIHDSSRSSLYDHQTPTKSKQKPYVYVSGGSDEEQQLSHSITPIPMVKNIESTSYEPDYIAPSSVKRHEYRIEEEAHRNGQSPAAKKRTPINRQDYENFEKTTRSKRKTRPEQKAKIMNDRQYNKQSSPVILSDAARYLNSSMKTRVNDYDSGIGTTNLTKLSHDSKLYTSTMNESHFHSFDEEQESISSSNSSNSDFAGSRSPYRFDNSLSNRRKTQGRYDPHSSCMEARVAGSFDSHTPTSSISKRAHRSDHTWKPQRMSSHHRARLLPLHRSTSSGRHEIESSKMKYSHSFASPKRSTQHSSYYQQTVPSSSPQKIYRSSLYINRPNTYGLVQENNIIFSRHESKKKASPTRVYCELPSQEKLHHCAECGTMTNYHHRHHFNSTVRRVTSHVDDLGYDSGYGERNKWDPYNDNVSSSDTDSDLTQNNPEASQLDEVYNRAEKVLYSAQNLSRHINRQLKLTLATI
ncbi:unnamed protein product [Rotaria magnacalcarata]|uniref:Uncharacterized protein n=1 Tax=Rotaria magnacalcarata TaxID=392030 RepID=A0A819FSM9_9BILA|nr:unnamed protein product [Rotaria magnacalcarata]